MLSGVQVNSEQGGHESLAEAGDRLMSSRQQGGRSTIGTPKQRKVVNFIWFF